MFQAFVCHRGEAQHRRGGIMGAIPEDVIDYLVHRDLSGGGRTIVHNPDCLTRSPTGDCGCPTRLAAETLRGIASKIRTRFYELGYAGPWDGLAASGNPADSKAVDNLLLSVAEEQAQAGCFVESARMKAMLPQKLEIFITKIMEEAEAAFGKALYTEYVRRLQDSAWFAVQFRSLNRGGELSDLRTEQTIFGPNDSCLVFQFTFSKVLRDGSSHEFAVQQREGDPTCPVRAMRCYVTMSTRLLNWDWSLPGAKVFADFDSVGARQAFGVTAGAMRKRFRAYLQRFNMDENESLHGLRAGGALSMALNGRSLAEIMLQGFWKSPSTAQHYVGLLREAIGEEFVQALAHSHGTAFVNQGLESPADPYDFLR